MFKTQQELFNLFSEERKRQMIERDSVPGVGVFSSLHTKAYDLEAREYPDGKITVEIFLKGWERLEYYYVNNREYALLLMNNWGEELKMLESQETPERELFKVYDERSSVPGVGMFASLHTTAYDLQGWEYLYGKITVEMFFKTGTEDDDGRELEYREARDREHALQLLSSWGDEIKTLESQETPIAV